MTSIQKINISSPIITFGNASKGKDVLKSLRQQFPNECKTFTMDKKTFQLYAEDVKAFIKKMFDAKESVKNSKIKFGPKVKK